VQVTNVEKKVESIVHTLETPIEKGSRIIGHIDVERRRRLMVHHSSTHLILGVMRSYLGEQVWQAGAQKGVESSRIDISYNRKLTEEDVREIERRCLIAIMENRKIKASFMDWNKATEKYGFRLFEGGVPLSSKLRVVEIEGVDIEGCGGTHLSNTGEIGIIKIISAESIQEGIQRIIFCAGKSALDYIQANYSQLNQIRKDTRITSEDVSNGVQKLTQENVDLRKRLELYIKTQAESLYASSQETTIGQHRWNLIHGNIDQDVYQFLIKYIMSKNTNFIILNEEDLTISVICREPSISKELLDSIPHNSIVKPSRFIKIELSRDQFSEYLKILK
jgi:alanyl-tRNA synthetase